MATTKASKAPASKTESFEAAEKGSKWVMSNSGLYGRTDKGTRYRISDPFQIIGNVSDIAGNSYGTVLRWQDDRLRKKQRFFALRLFASGGREICAELLDGGLRIENQKIFLKYMWERGRTAPKAHLADRVGWFDSARFVLPDVILDGQVGDGGKVIYAPPSDTPHYFNVAGTLDEWRDNIGVRCIGNSRLVLAACGAFAGPLIKLVGAESGGIHLRGGSSIGKTTAHVWAVR